MRIRELRLLNWMPFAGAHVLELPAGPIAVVARYRDNPRRSNWAGKTALIEAIRWCLFGVHRKRLDDDVISNGGAECEVRLDLGEMFVTRSRVRGKSTVLGVDVAGDSFRGPAAQQVILERLCMSLDDYEATIDFKQDDVESIVGMRTGKRREVIAAWLRLEKWTTASKRAAQRASTAMQALTEVRAALRVDEEVLDEEQEQQLRGDVERLERGIIELKERIAQTDASIAAFGDPQRLKQQVEELARLRETVSNLRGRLKAKAARTKERDALATEYLTAAEVATTASKLVQEREAFQTGGFDGVCPVTCDACPVTGQVSATVMSKTYLLHDAQAARLVALRAKDEVSKRLDHANAQLRDLDRFAADHAAAVHRGKELAAVRVSPGLTIGDLAVSDVEPRCSELSMMKHLRKLDADALELSVAQLAGVREKLAASERARTRKAQREQELVAAEREVRIATLMVRALGPSGVPARIARAHVERLEQAANELLRDSGLSIEFGWERATKDLTPTCAECGFVYVGQRDKACPRCAADRGPKMSEELEILVDDASGEVEDVKAKSGGARVLVASALRLSASAMLRDVRGTPVCWATIDEPFGPLDEENRVALARVFGGMLGSVGLEQAFVVSHDVALLDSLPHRIVVERGGGASTLRLEAA